MPPSGSDSVPRYPFFIMVKDKRFGSKKQPCTPNFNPCCYCIMNDVYKCCIPLDTINSKEHRESEDYEWGCSCCINANRKCYQVPTCMKDMVFKAMIFLIATQPAEWDFQHDRMSPIKNELKRLLPRGYENGNAEVHKGYIDVEWAGNESLKNRPSTGIPKKRARADSDDEDATESVRIKREESASAEESSKEATEVAGGGRESSVEEQQHDARKACSSDEDSEPEVQNKPRKKLAKSHKAPSSFVPTHDYDSDELSDEMDRLRRQSVINHGRAIPGRRQE
ncbi:hypothetical protein BDZ85DRAFT_319338 [Elsinoe ampelina]|uniref:Uncharacterized protein n=1 Tax=Elsinoe ampelina TaxID=302913 RepID=A0A6A6GBD8_9PEZI|nr:hypothetical protein BDZ85DRAFT_319338 [Elsinoe ampelina]